MEPAETEKWEYTYYWINIAGFGGANEKKATEGVYQELNALGEKGWELVSAYPLSTAGTDSHVVHWFKRRKAT